jgi:hypothetical protein
MIAIARIWCKNVANFLKTSYIFFYINGCVLRQYGAKIMPIWAVCV